MAVARTYNVDAEQTTGISIGTGGVPGTEYVLMYGGSAGEFNVSAVRVSTYSGSSASYPSNGTITWRLRRVSSTSTGILAGTATFATPGAVVWSQTIPCTAGANWGEWFTPGFELNQTNGTLALTYELGAAGTTSAVNLMAELVISE